MGCAWASDVAGAACAEEYEPFYGWVVRSSSAARSLSSVVLESRSLFFPEIDIGRAELICEREFRVGVFGTGVLPLSCVLGVLALLYCDCVCILGDTSLEKSSIKLLTQVYFLHSWDFLPWCSTCRHAMQLGCF